MKKIKFNLDDLKVESFVTTPGEPDKAGTVFAQYTIFEETCVWDTCQTYYHCDTWGYQMTCAGACSNDTCWGRGEYTCDQSCNCGTPVFCTTNEYTDCPECAGYTQPDTDCTTNGCTECHGVC